MVLQLNLPADAEQYIHRLGRTARAGAAGRGVLVLDPAEEVFLRKKEVRGLGLVKDTEFHASTTTTPTPAASTAAAALASTQASLAASTLEIQRTLSSGAVERETKAAAYRAWLGYYNGAAKELGWSKERVVREAGGYARASIGWSEGDVPDVEARAVGKMGLRGVPGLNIVSGKQGGRGGRGGAGPGPAVGRGGAGAIIGGQARAGPGEQPRGEGRGGGGLGRGDRNNARGGGAGGGRGTGVGPRRGGGGGRGGPVQG